MNTVIIPLTQIYTYMVCLHEPPILLLVGCSLLLLMLPRSPPSPPRANCTVIYSPALPSMLLTKKASCASAGMSLVLRFERAANHGMFGCYFADDAVQRMVRECILSLLSYSRAFFQALPLCSAAWLPPLRGPWALRHRLAAVLPFSQRLFTGRCASVTMINDLE